MLDIFEFLYCTERLRSMNELPGLKSRISDDTTFLTLLVWRIQKGNAANVLKVHSYLPFFGHSVGYYS